MRDLFGDFEKFKLLKPVHYYSKVYMLSTFICGTFSSSPLHAVSWLERFDLLIELIANYAIHCKNTVFDWKSGLEVLISSHES